MDRERSNTLRSELDAIYDLIGLTRRLAFTTRRQLWLEYACYDPKSYAYRYHGLSHLANASIARELNALVITEKDDDDNPRNFTVTCNLMLGRLQPHYREKLDDRKYSILELGFVNCGSHLYLDLTCEQFHGIITPIEEDFYLGGDIPGWFLPDRSKLSSSIGSRWIRDVGTADYDLIEAIKSFETIWLASEARRKRLTADQERFELDLSDHGCGYWSVCTDHACPCSPDAPVSQGYSRDVWERLAFERDCQTL